MSDKSFSEVMERERRKADADREAPREEVNVLLPKAGDAYEAASRPSNKPLSRLWLVMGRDEFKPGGKPYRFFQYVHLDSDGAISFNASGQTLTFRFSGMTPVQVEVSGRNLLQIADYLSLHRIAWLRVADRDFRGAGDQPVITDVRIEPLRARNASVPDR